MYSQGALLDGMETASKRWRKMQLAIDDLQDAPLPPGFAVQESESRVQSDVRMMLTLSAQERHNRVQALAVKVQNLHKVVIELSQAHDVRESWILGTSEEQRTEYRTRKAFVEQKEHERDIVREALTQIKGEIGTCKGQILSLKQRSLELLRAADQAKKDHQAAVKQTAEEIINVKALRKRAQTAEADAFAAVRMSATETASAKGGMVLERLARDLESAREDLVGAKEACDVALQVARLCALSVCLSVCEYARCVYVCVRICAYIL